MRLLVSNDDGIHSEGLAMLARVARRFGDVLVVAPDVVNSSASHSISASRPLSLRRTDFADGIEAYRVNGTPADCVALGTFHQPDVDIVLSGVNNGTNLGNAIWHSGTMAAARQGALLGARGIALSRAVASAEADYSALEEHVGIALELLVPRDDVRLANVNVPPSARGIRWARQAVDKYDGQVFPANDPYGRPIFWLTVTQLREHEPDTDLWAFERGYITVTPLTIDITAEEQLDALDESVRVVEFEPSPPPTKPVVDEATMRDAVSAD